MAIADGIDNVTIDAISPAVDFKDAKMNAGMHFSSPAAFYRMAIPELFSNYSRVLYLDCDVIVEDDVAPLFDTPLKSQHCIAAAPAIGIIQAVRRGRKIDHCGRTLLLSDYYRGWVGIDDISTYFNSGVILFDIDRIKALKPFYKDSYSKVIGTEFHMPDQDMLNILFSGETTLLDVAWNFQNPSLDYVDLPPSLLDDTRRAKAAPKIIHYVTDKKPWNSLGVGRGRAFWSCADKTPFHAEMKQTFDAVIADSIPAINSVEDDATRSVSVVLPTHEASATLGAAVASALNQDICGQVIIVDDGSTDMSLAVANRLAELDDRVEVVALEKNLGAGNARNTGLDRATGEFVAFLDPDDLYEDEKSLSRLLTALRAHGADASLGGQMSLRPDGASVRKATSENPETSGPVRFSENAFLWPCLHHHRFLFNRAYLQSHGLRYSEHLRGQDVVFLARFMATDPRLFAISEPVHRHRVRTTPIALTFRQTVDRADAFAEAVETVHRAGYARQAWHLARSRFESLLTNLQDFADHPEAVRLLKNFSAFRDLRGAYFDGGVYADEDFKARMSGAMLASLLSLSNEELLSILKAHDRHPFTPIAANEKASLAAVRREDERRAMVFASRKATKLLEVEQAKTKRLSARLEAEQTRRRIVAREPLPKKHAEQVKARALHGSGVRLIWDRLLIQRSHLFNASWYLRRNPDVAQAGVSAAEHFLRHGCSEGRNPSPFFNVRDYYRRNPDVARNGMNALVHHLRHGRREGR